MFRHIISIGLVLVTCAFSGSIAFAQALAGDWNKVVEAARKEGEVIVWGTGGDLRFAFWKGAFESAYPGITVKLFAPSTLSERDSRYIREHEAGIAKVDILVGGTGGMMGRLKPAGLLQPLRPLMRQEILNPNNWLGEPTWTDKDKKWSLVSDITPAAAAAVNASVKDDEFQSWTSLLSPKFDGKIVMSDPRQAGPGFALALFMFFNKDLGPDFVSQLFARGRVQISLDERQMAEWVDAGRMLVTLYPRQREVDQLRALGGTLRLVPALKAGGVPQSIVVGSDGAIGVPDLDPLPHPNAARVYIDWLYSKAGQQAMVDVLGIASTRSDVDMSKLSPSVRPIAGVHYTSVNDETLQAPESAKAMRDVVAKALAER